MSYPGNPPAYSGPGQDVPMVQLQPMPRPQVVTTVPVVVSQSMGSDPVMVVCTSCRYQIVTKTEIRPSTKTHLFAVCLFVLGCWPCIWVPYCTPSCMNVNHYCPNCNVFIGNYQ